MADSLAMGETGTYLRTLARIVRTLGPGVSFQASLRSLLAILAEEHGFLRPNVSIFDPRKQVLALCLTHGPVKNAHAVYEPGQGVTGQVYSTGLPIVAPRMKDHPAFLNRAFDRTEEELAELAFLCVPVFAPGQEGAASEVIGTLSVDSPATDSDTLTQQRQFLEVVAGIIANHAAYLQEDLARPSTVRSPAPDVAELGLERDSIVAASKSMGAVLDQIVQVGPSRATALLRGESGTGKELLAEAVHRASPRRDMPLVKLNCAALPSELVESELFGFQKGAFTGAVAPKRGLFEMAHKGTLFLDEIGELSPSAQAKVLRAIQEQEIQRLGSEQTIRVDVRLICATHQPLEKRVGGGGVPGGSVLPH